MRVQKWSGDVDLRSVFFMSTGADSIGSRKMCLSGWPVCFEWGVPVFVQGAAVDKWKMFLRGW